MAGPAARSEASTVARSPTRRSTPRRLSAFVFLGLIVVTALSVWLTDSAVVAQENRLLKERGNEVAVVLGVAVSNLSSELDTVGAVLRATNSSPAAFSEAATPLAQAPGGAKALALLRPDGQGFRVVLATGQGLVQGQVITDARAAAIRRSLTANDMVPTQVFGSGAARSVGFAVGPPQAPAGTVVYQQISLGALGPPREAGSAPFSEVQIVLYANEQAMPSQALVSTAKSLPLKGSVRTSTVPAGAATWRLEVRAEHPLVGTGTADAPWLVAAAGLVTCILVTAVVEIESRRRTSALALYDSEHRQAVGLQRELLPKLPDLSTVQLAAHYVPGAAGQQVGGDWYDVFAIAGDRIGIVIGDVVGHDISAAATMSRVQAALRAYAMEDHDPARVLDQLDALLGSLGSDRLATVFFGVLGPADRTGPRTLSYANAGHLPPLACDPAGLVRELDSATSLLLGTALGGQQPREVKVEQIAPGSTLIFYTDGLVEVPGESIVDNIERLKSDLVGTDRGTDPDELCNRIVARPRAAALRDDVAVLVVRPGRG